MENISEKQKFYLKKTIEINDSKIYVTAKRGKINFIYNSRVIYDGVPFQDVILYKDVNIEEDKVKLTYIKNKIKVSNNNKLIETIPTEQISYMDFGLFDFG